MLAAFGFLTALPLPPPRDGSAPHMGRSVAYFPVVGLVLGAVLVALDWVLRLALPVSIVSALLVLALVLLTGGLHLDGLIDTCDGLGARGGAERRREVLRDSRVGSFGVIGAIFLILIEYLTVSSLTDPARWAALVTAPVVARWAIVWIIQLFPYARPTGLGTAFKQHVSWPRLAVATAVTLIVVIAVLRLSGLLIMGGVLVLALLLALYLRRTFDGLTGDTYGAIIEITELAALLSVIVLPSGWW